MVQGGYLDPGTVMTTLGLVPCLAGAITLGRRLAGGRAGDSRFQIRDFKFEISNNYD
jgi:hypothetical protein